jgi:hypothetical protein
MKCSKTRSGGASMKMAAVSGSAVIVGFDRVFETPQAGWPQFNGCSAVPCGTSNVTGW